MLFIFRSSNLPRVHKIARYLSVRKLVLFLFLMGSFFPGEDTPSINQSFASNENDIELLLNVRSIQYSFNDDQDSEKDMTERFEVLERKASEIAFILIDVWAYHPIEGWMERAEVNIQDRLYPLLREARKAGVYIIHAAHGNEIHPLATPQEGEMILDSQYDAYQLFEELRNKGIKTINICRICNQHVCPGQTSWNDWGKDARF